MADIVMGFGTSHGPLLATPPHEWDLRAAVDRRNKELAWRDGTYDFETLASLRKNDGFDAQNAPEVRSERFERCQAQLDALGERVRAVAPDVLLIVGDDHHEWFMKDVQPAFSVYHGETLLNRAPSPAEEAHMTSTGNGYAMRIYYPTVDEVYPCPSNLSAHIIKNLVRQNFDVTACGEQPADNGVARRLGHSFGFVNRRILSPMQLPLIPVMVNTYYPPNQPTAQRCFEFGRAIGRAIAAWPGPERVAVAASGGMTHFVIDEEMDRRLLQAMLERDYDAVTFEPEAHFRSGTSEIKNWIVVAGVIAETKLRMQLLDYAPCYRSEAGTGSGMAFATWE